MIRDLSILIWLILGFTSVNLISGDAFLASSLSTLIADLWGILKYELVRGSLSNILGSCWDPSAMTGDMLQVTCGS